jgi:AbrB family looped-hinge helix DNA binding protein
MANVVGDRYQITIDKRVRDQLGVQPGDLAIEAVEDDRLVVTFVPRPHRDSLLGALRKPGTAPIRDWQEFKDAAWRERSREVIDGMRGRS